MHKSQYTDCNFGTITVCMFLSNEYSKYAPTKVYERCLFSRICNMYTPTLLYISTRNENKSSFFLNDYSSYIKTIKGKKRFVIRLDINEK